MRKFLPLPILAIIAALVFILPGAVKGAVQAPAFPDLIALPTGFQPEGIAVGQGTTFYTGSLVDGRVLAGDLRTGQTSVLVAGQTGQVSVGMAYDGRSNALFVAGGATGKARVFDASSGSLLATYQLASAGNFINDVIVTQQAAYFTNSSQAIFYKVPLSPGGSLPAPADVQAIPLTGDWEQEANAFNANGIEASPNGKWLIIVNTNQGTLFRVDPVSGEATEIVLDGDTVSAGDGLLLRGSLLYVVRNQMNEIVVIDLSRDPDNASADIVTTIHNANFAVPTTIAAFGNDLYAVNAKFGFPNPTTQPYEIVKVPLP